MVVTAFPPARGFINERDFVEFRALASAEGVVVEPLADDVKVELAPDKIIVSRPMGLALSTSLQTLLRGSGLRPTMFDSQLWGFDQQASYTERQSKLVAAAASAPDNKRLAPRLDLARFYVARDMFPEAKGVLDVALADERAASEQGSAAVLRAVTEIMMNRPDDALKDLADPSIGDQHDAPLWRALAYAKQGKWAQARDGFKTADAAVATLPVELQRVALKEEMRSAIEVGDFSTASSQLNDFQTIGVPHELEPAMAVLIGRLAEGMGRNEDALAAYQTAADSWDRRAAAQGQLRETLLRYSLGDLKRDDVISQLETLTTIWRGDETEIEALQMLARLYTAEGRYRDSFYVMRSAHRRASQFRHDAAHPAGGGADFRLAVPRRQGRHDAGDRCAGAVLRFPRAHPDRPPRRRDDPPPCRPPGLGRSARSGRRAVAIPGRQPLAGRRARASGDAAGGDLSDEPQGRPRAGDAARHPHRRSHQRCAQPAPAARSARAVRHGPARSGAGSDRQSRRPRSRSGCAPTSIGRGGTGAKPPSRSSCCTASAGRIGQPLNDIERSDILRAELGYALGEDTLGLGRFREKYAAKMAGTPDAHAFEVVSAPLGTSGTEFAAIAHAAAAVDTLDGFLRDMQAHYPDASASPPNAGQPAPPDAPQAGAPAPAVPPMPSIVPPARAAGRTALR